jgi:hypothetical protein
MRALHLQVQGASTSLPQAVAEARPLSQGEAAATFRN